MDAKMFNLLTEQSAESAHFDDMQDRFEVLDGEFNGSGELPYFHWFGDNSAAAVMGRDWLIEQGYKVTLLWDLATHPNGDFLGYLVATDFWNYS